MRRKQLLYPAVLVFLAGLLMLFTYSGESLFGSSCDWFSQHVSIAETIRQTMLAEGTPFIGQLPLGGGSNVYNFSYYGYLRPDVMLACLLPDVAMETILVVYSVAGYLISVLLFFVLMKKCKLKDEIALLGGVLFLCAGCFFQVHRQIMFINYMPFLLGALLCVRDCRKKGKRSILILMMVLIELHSYYYAISCLLAIYLFLLYSAGWPIKDEEDVARIADSGCGDERQQERAGAAWRDCLASWWRLTWRYAVWVLTSVAMAGALLLPTAVSILNAAGKDGGSASKNPLEFQWDFSSLLYNGYGLGLTMLALFLLVAALSVKKTRFLGAVLLFALVCGLIPLILNGFLYNRAKILIPFLPLVLVLCMETLWHFWEQHKSPPLWCLIPVAVAGWLQYAANEIWWILVDMLAVAVVFALFVWRSGKLGLLRPGVRATEPESLSGDAESVEKGDTESTETGEHAAAGARQNWLLCTLLFVMCILIYAFAVNLHRNDNLITREAAYKGSFEKEEVQEFYKDTNYRFDTTVSPYQAANRLMAWGAGRTSEYTSTGNKRYGSFYYDEMRNTLGNNNRVGVYNRANPFFQYLMGVRYLEAPEKRLPYGYEVKVRKGDVVLGEWENVLPLCYGTTELLPQSEYDKLDFPETLEAMTSRSVVPDAAGKEVGKGQVSEHEGGFTSHFKELFPEEGRDYEIQKKNDHDFKVIPREPMKDQILVVVLHVKQKSAAAVSITINGIKNKLSGTEAPYPNQNEDFVYYLSSREPMAEFSVKTSGAFEVTESHVYSLPSTCLGDRIVYPLTDTDGAVSFSGKEKLSGSITMPKDGYCITSFPMEPGYTAYVDGEPCEVETVNQVFAGFPLKAGTHKIQICYEPPLQKAGMALSTLGWLIWLGMIFLPRLGQRKRIVGAE